jgi:signal peptidase I
LILSIILGIFIICFISINFHKKVASFDRISEKDIEIYPDKVIINISNVKLTKYADTNSMIPTLDSGHTGLKIDVKNESDIKIGDIISYESDENFCISENKTSCSITNLIVHRVIKIGEDKEGTYFVTKGDNNFMSDGKIRYSQIRGVLIALIF